MRKQTIKPAVFDGSNRLEVDTSKTSYSALSASVNFKDNSSADLSRIISLDGTASARIINNGALYSVVITYDDGASVTANSQAVTKSDSNNISFSFDPSGVTDALKLYINGDLSDAVDGLSGKSFSALSGVVTVGQDAAGEAHSAIVSESLWTDDDHKRLYNQGLNISASNLNRLGLNQGLVCAYALDEENEGIDLSGNENHLSNINNVTFNGSDVDTLHTGIQTQNTLKADGSQYLTGAKISEVGEDFFFSCFAKFDDPSAHQKETIYNEAFKTFIQVDLFGEKIVANYTDTIGSNNINFNQTVEQGRLYHLCLEVDSGTNVMAFYVDGVLVGTDTVSDTNKANSTSRIYNDAFGSRPLHGSLHNIYFGKKAFGQTGVDWFRNKGVPRDLSVIPSNYADEAISIYEPTLANGGKDISGNGNDCSIVGTPAYTAVEEVQKVSDYMFPVIETFNASKFGASTYVSTPQLIEEYPNEQSLVFWGRLVNVTNSQYLMTIDRGHMVGLESISLLRTYYWYASGSSYVDHTLSVPLEVGEDYLIISTYKQGEGMRLYLNGVELPQSKSTAPVQLRNWPNYAGFTSGSNYSSQPLAENTEVMQTLCYDRCLTGSEISAMYNSGNVIMPDKMSAIGTDDYIHALTAKNGMSQDLATGLNTTIVGTITDGDEYNG